MMLRKLFVRLILSTRNLQKRSSSSGVIGLWRSRHGFTMQSRCFRQRLSMWKADQLFL